MRLQGTTPSYGVSSVSGGGLVPLSITWQSAGRFINFRRPDSDVVGCELGLDEHDGRVARFTIIDLPPQVEPEELGWRFDSSEPGLPVFGLDAFEGVTPARLTARTFETNVAYALTTELVFVRLTSVLGLRWIGDDRVRFGFDTEGWLAGLAIDRPMIPWESPLSLGS